MSLSNYDGLKDAVRRWSKRKDAIGDFIDDFIVLAEEKIYSNEIAPLRIKEMDTRATATASTTSRFLALPDRFLDMRRLKVNAQTDTVPGPVNDCDIRFQAPDQLLLSNITDIPGFFSVTSQLEFERIPDREYEIEMQYFAEEIPLSGDNTVNAVLTKYPSIYLNGTLWALWQHYKEEELSEYYLTKCLNAIGAANKSENKSRYGNAPQIRKERRGP